MVKTRKKKEMLKERMEGREGEFKWGLGGIVKVENNMAAIVKGSKHWLQQSTFNNGYVRHYLLCNLHHLPVCLIIQRTIYTKRYAQRTYVDSHDYTYKHRHTNIYTEHTLSPHCSLPFSCSFCIITL